MFAYLPLFQFGRVAHKVTLNCVNFHLLSKTVTKIRKKKEKVQGTPVPGTNVK